MSSVFDTDKFYKDLFERDDFPPLTEETLAFFDGPTESINCQDLEVASQGHSLPTPPIAAGDIEESSPYDAALPSDNCYADGYGDEEFIWQLQQATVDQPVATESHINETQGTQVMAADFEESLPDLLAGDATSSGDIDPFGPHEDQWASPAQQPSPVPSFLSIESTGIPQNPMPGTLNATANQAMAPAITPVAPSFQHITPSIRGLQRQLSNPLCGQSMDIPQRSMPATLPMQPTSFDTAFVSQHSSVTQASAPASSASIVLPPPAFAQLGFEAAPMHRRVPLPAQSKQPPRPNWLKDDRKTPECPMKPLPGTPPPTRPPSADSGSGQETSGSSQTSSEQGSDGSGSQTTTSPSGSPPLTLSRNARPSRQGQSIGHFSCKHCKTDKKKCTWELGSETCNLCMKKGRQCTRDGVDRRFRSQRAN